MADEDRVLSPKSIQKLKVADLKRELKDRGLNNQGNKGELVDRLIQAMHSLKGEEGSAGSVDDLIDEDEVLNDEEIEDEVADISDKNLELDGDKSFEVTTASKTIKRKSSESSEALRSPRSDSVDSTNKAKKIVLNRHLSDDTEQAVTATDNVSDTNDKTEAKQVVKLSELSVKERLEMRAKKFGAPVTADVKKLVRAERFGQPANNTTSSDGTKKTITFNNTTTDVDLLKKRAERFGAVVSTKLTKVELQEKLEQRKARFGSTNTTNGSTVDTQKAKRLERFKTTLK